MAFIISAAVLLIVCAVIWRFGPVVLAPALVSPQTAQAICALIVILLVLSWGTGAFYDGWHMPWRWHR